MKRTSLLLPWVVGIMLSTLLFGFLSNANMLMYSGTDDAPILRAYMGFEGGEPATFSMLIHPVMGWMLYGLAKLFPGVGWFSLFQLFFLWFSSAVVVKSLMRCTALHGRGSWLGAGLGALTVVAGALWISMRISFTTTAAWLGAAAVVQLGSIDWAHGKRAAIGRGMALSISLLTLCYFLRQVAVLPPLAFWLLGLGLAWLTHRKEAHRPLLRPLLTGVAACAALLLALTGVRLLETKFADTEEVYRWHDASGLLLDYADLQHITPTDDALAEIGWSRPEYTLFTYWYFMDDNMTPDHMVHLYENTFQSAAPSGGERLAVALQTVRDAVTGTPSQLYGIVFGLLAAALCLLLAALRGFSKPFLWLGALAAPGLGLLLLGYLGWEGRLPMRAMLSVTLPMIALCIWLLACSLAPLSGARVRNVLGVLLCALLLLPAAQGATLAWAESLKDVAAELEEQENNGTPVVEDLDMYAAENPDTLFVYDLSLVSDNRLFPAMPAELAGNVLFWGGHPARSPSWFRTLAKYGITQMDASLFVRDNVLLASTDPEPWPSLMDYIHTQLQTDVEWEYAESYGVINFFRIYTY